MGVGERGIAEVAGTVAGEAVAGTAPGDAVVGTGPSAVRDPIPPPRPGVVGRGAQDAARLAGALALPQAEPVLQIPLPRIAIRVRSRTALACGVAFPWCCCVVGSCLHRVVHERISGSKRLFQTVY